MFLIESWLLWRQSIYMLCGWHLDKNMEASLFWNISIRWMKLINSHYESLSDESWRLFEVRSKEFVLVLHYIERTWLPFEEFMEWKIRTLWELSHLIRSLGRSLSAKKIFHMVIFDWREAEFARPRKINSALQNNSYNVLFIMENRCYVIF